MYQIFRFTFSIAVLLMAAATIAHAEERGEISLTIDGVALHFEVDTDRSEWTKLDPERAYQSITAPAADEITREKYTYFSLGFELNGSAVVNSAANLYHHTNVGIERWYGDHERTGLTVIIQEHIVEGDTRTISGSFSTDLIDFASVFGSSDPIDMVQVSGTFSVVLDRM